MLVFEGAHKEVNGHLECVDLGTGAAPPTGEHAHRWNTREGQRVDSAVLTVVLALLKVMSMTDRSRSPEQDSCDSGSISVRMFQSLIPSGQPYCAHRCACFGGVTSVLLLALQVSSCTSKRLHHVTITGYYGASYGVNGIGGNRAERHYALLDYLSVIIFLLVT